MISPRNVPKLQYDLIQAFQIPLNVSKESITGGYGWTITPVLENPEDYGFDIRTDVSDFKTSVTFIPGKFSGELFRNMWHADDLKRNIFQSFVNRIISESGKILLKINGIPYNPLDSKEWTKDVWRTFDLSIYQYHECEEEEDFERQAFIWGGYGLCMIMSLLDWQLSCDSESEITPACDGAKSKVTVNHYERRPENRFLCLRKYGYQCQVCGIDMDKRFGELGKKVIEVHHLHPVSELEGPVMINPETDLIPVCPTCHKLIHSRTPPHTPDEVKTIIKNGFKTPEY